jgi:hypothetical protein
MSAGSKFCLLVITAALCACGGGGSSTPETSNVPPVPPPVNSAPVAFDVTGKTNMDEPLDGQLDGRDVDGDILTYSITELPTMGSVEIVDAATGAFRFTPQAAAYGTDLFRYRVNDGSDNSEEAAVTVVINSKPVVQDGTLRVATSLPAPGALTATDLDGDALTFELLGQPANGTIQDFDAVSGSFTYVASAGFEGADSFTYRSNDGFADSETATIVVSVNEWLGTVSFGTADEEDAVYGLDIDSQDNLYVAYTTTGSVPGAMSAGGADVVLAKVDKSGTVLWQKQWGHSADESAYQLVRSSDGSLYLTASVFESDVRTGAYIVKFDETGDLLWELPMLEPNAAVLLYRLVEAPTGNLFVNAWANPLSQLLKITPDGTIDWIKYLGTSAEDPVDPLLEGQYDAVNYLFARDLAVDANETVYSTLNLIYTPAGGQTTGMRAMLASFDGNGTILTRLEPLVTSASPDVDNGARLRDVRLTNSGNLRVAGDTGGVLAVAELDTAGNEIWSTSRAVTGEVRYGFRGALMADGSSIVAGDSGLEASDGTMPDVAVTKFDAVGNFQWESILSGVRADGTSDVDDFAGQPIIDSDGSIFMLVRSDGGAIGTGSNQGGLDVFLVKLDGDTGEMIHP